MTENTTTPSNEPDPTGSSISTKRCNRGGRSWFFVISMLAAGAIIGTFATKAISHGSGDGHWRGSHHGSWHGKHGNNAGHHGGFGKIMRLMRHGGDPARMEKRATRMIKHVAVELDATSEQSDKLVSIVSTLVREVAPMRAELKSTRRAVADILTSENPDRAKLEQLRAEQLTRWDSASKRVLGAMADASAVLTDEQRTKVRQRLERFRKHHDGGRWHKRGGSRDGSENRSDDTPEDPSE